MSSAPDGGIPDALYAEICESVRSIHSVLDLMALDPASPLEEWRAWSKGILSGLCYRRTAERAAEAARSGLRTADQLSETWIAESAARAAESVVLAIEGRHRIASALAAQAASLAEQSRAACRSRGAAS